MCSYAFWDEQQVLQADLHIKGAHTCGRCAPGPAALTVSKI